MTGIVETPDPSDLERVRVLVESGTETAPDDWLPGSEPPKGAWLRDNGFKIRVRNDRESTITAWHPWLVPAADSGTVRVRGGRDGVVLELVLGDELQLPAPQLKPSYRTRIARYAADSPAKGAPLAWHNAPLIDGTIRCAIPAGRWTLWVDPGREFAPLVLNHVAIDGSTRIEEAKFSSGSTLRISVLVPEGTDTPRIYVSAKSSGVPQLLRSLNSDGESPVLLSGLEAGRYTLYMGAVMGDLERPPTREIEVDGVSDLDLELDLR